MTDGAGGLDGPDIPEDEFIFNGVDADTGSYLFPRTPLDRVASAARGSGRIRRISPISKPAGSPTPKIASQ